MQGSQMTVLDTPQQQFTYKLFETLTNALDVIQGDHNTGGIATLLFSTKRVDSFKSPDRSSRGLETGSTA